MSRISFIARWLGRKFILCAIAMTLVTGVFIWLRKAELFGEYCLFMGTTLGGFFGSNVWAGKIGLPGKSAQDSKDMKHEE